ncbi:hypothetical protein ADUPG1_007811 [Aduncisulcus paluster]|uniref:Guanine nucleotide-binding protein subunit beta-like protein n=1 Tax=Aduncisulcus paluster TaxID=2918883 RepID=A0ABQ5KPL2_9EUKA|nr:hypothetical protein ADUPG1_007811 [Aduncisulcus paluster]
MDWYLSGQKRVHYIVKHYPQTLARIQFFPQYVIHCHSETQRKDIYSHSGVESDQKSREQSSSEKSTSATHLNCALIYDGMKEYTELDVKKKRFGYDLNAILMSIGGYKASFHSIPFKMFHQTVQTETPSLIMHFKESPPKLTGSTVPSGSSKSFSNHLTNCCHIIHPVTNDKIAVIGTDSGKIHIINITQQRTEGILLGHGYHPKCNPFSMHTSPPSRTPMISSLVSCEDAGVPWYVVSCGLDGTIRVWDIMSMLCVGICEVYVSSKEKKVISVSPPLAKSEPAQLWAVSVRRIHRISNNPSYPSPEVRDEFFVKDVPVPSVHRTPTTAAIYDPNQIFHGEDPVFSPASKSDAKTSDCITSSIMSDKCVCVCGEFRDVAVCVWEWSEMIEHSARIGKISQDSHSSSLPLPLVFGVTHIINGDERETRNVWVRIEKGDDQIEQKNLMEKKKEEEEELRKKEDDLKEKLSKRPSKEEEEDRRRVFR